MEIRRLHPEEHSLITDLYFRTYGFERSEAKQTWMDKNPLGTPLYYGAFEGDVLYGSTGLAPWLMSDGSMRYQFIDSFIDPLKRGKGLYHKILDFIFDDIKGKDYEAPMYTIPNSASEPGFKRKFHKLHSRIPRWILWLKVSATPLRFLGPLSRPFSFLLSAKPKSLGLNWMDTEHFEGDDADFFNWRFGPGNSDPWQIIHVDKYYGCYQIQKEKRIQIGLWPSRIEYYPSYILSILKKNPEATRLEWPGQVNAEIEKALKECGFRTSFLGKKTWRNAFYTNEKNCPAMNRVQYDT